MAGHLSKIFGGSAGRCIIPLTAKRTGSKQNDKFPKMSVASCAPAAFKFPTSLISRAYSNFMNCEKDEWSQRCGQSLLRKPPCKDVTAVCKNPRPPCKDYPCEKKNKYESKCMDEFQERCDAGRQSKPPCSDHIRIGFKPYNKLSPQEMLFYSAECCPPCLPLLPRFDALYYKIRKLNEREYCPTWSDCPTPRIVPKLKCCYPSEPYVPPRRTKCDIPPTACPWEALNNKLKVCKVGGDPNCVKIRMPCCCPARNPPNCYRVRQPICVDRLPAPAPCFSECCKPPGKPRRPTECDCLGMLPLCAANLINFNAT